MHITILALGSRGDIQPYATLGQGLQAAGCRVRFITFENFAPLIVASGLDFHPIRGDAQALVAHAQANMLSLVRSFGSLAESYARDLSVPHLGETDLIINQLPLGFYGYDLAEKFGVPMILASVIPLARTGTFPMMGFPRLPLPGYNRATYFLAEQLAWQMFRGVINRWRHLTLRLPPLPLTGYLHRLGTRQIPIINGFSPQVVPRPADWGEHIHVTGYWFPEDNTWQSPAELDAFLAAGKPPVFIGFGSMPLHRPAKPTAIILEALRQTGQRAILQAGWGGFGQPELPAEVFQLDYAPYGWLFPRMVMVIHHGGSGTTAFGLGAGVPSLVVPFVFDQFYWGEHIAALGVGPPPIRYRALSVERLKEAILLGTTNTHIRQKAAELGGRIRAEKGLEQAVNLIRQIFKHTSANVQFGPA